MRSVYSNSLRGSRVLCAAAALLAVACGTGAGLAQTSPAGGLTSVAPTKITKAGTLRQMSRAVTVTFNETRLEDAIKFLSEYTGAEMEPIWAGSSSDGLNKDLPITMNIKNTPALTVLERLLEKAQSDFSENSWQMTDLGSIEFGPKSALNKTKRVEIYDIHDLMFEVKRYNTVPQIDLQSLLQQSQGSGGGQSPFDDNDDDDQEKDREGKTPEDKGNELISLIVGLVEPEQWNDGGGDGGTIKYYQRSLIVNAPDYIHRGLAGYSWWPSGYSSAKVADRRYVSLNVGAENGTIDGIKNFPVTAVAGGAGNGGGGGPGGPPPGGGKEAKPGDAGAGSGAVKSQPKPAGAKAPAAKSTKKAPVKPTTPSGKK